ncbi:hypothetical protein ACOJQI_01615 [Bacillus salacetis]|uniref:hypothetical protein n=1 Tax=Bacillus salacetis TaxID=2315464 RepID=UPI003BA146EA
MPRQKFESADINPRYSKGRISPFGTNSLYPRIPWVAAWWSLTFPGFGHMFVGKYLHGFVLIIWELVVNTQSNLNMGIALTMLGRFEEAKAQLNQDWVLLYMSVYVYSIWDSYRSAVEINKSHVLSEVEDAPISPSNVSFFDVVILDKKKPWIGMVWSFLSPGLGQLYSGSTVVGTFILAWWIYVTYKAGAISAWLHSFLGDFDSAIMAVDWQWFLFLPSMYGFAIYQAYASVNQNNTLYDIEQIRYLRVRDENLAPKDSMNSGSLQILSTFEHSPFVEMAIHDMETLGISPQDIIALPMENLESETHILDSLHRVDGRSILDGAMVGGTVFMLLGSIYGFILAWGPVIWGLIGLVGGFIAGLLIELAISKNKTKLFSKRKSEVIVQVTCTSSQQDKLINILKNRRATGYLVLPQRVVSDT